MKFDCGPTFSEKVEAKEKWHKWFAWYPVRVGSHDCRWLEYVERKGELNSSFYDVYWTYEYRAI